jgi:hypothetical protein
MEFLGKLQRDDNTSAKVLDFYSNLNPILLGSTPNIRTDIFSRSMQTTFVI